LLRTARLNFRKLRGLSIHRK